jgi:hypothetical protein
MSDSLPHSAPGSATSAHEPLPSVERPGWQRGFWSLIVTQFQNAFNDNALKFIFRKTFGKI